VKKNVTSAGRAVSTEAKKGFNVIEKKFNELRSSTEIEEDSEEENDMTVQEVIEEEYTPLVFGLPLEEACKNFGTSSNVPLVVEECLKYLMEHKAYEELGIFRISGVFTHIKELKVKYDKGIPVDLNEVIEVHTVSGLLKLYYRELPETPFTFNLIQNINETENIENIEERSEAIANILSLLSIFNVSVLKALFQFLNVVAQHEEINKMGVSNLGIIFTPSLEISQGAFNFLIYNGELTFTKSLEKINNNSRDYNTSQTWRDLSKEIKKNEDDFNPFSNSYSKTTNQNNPFRKSQPQRQYNPF